TQLRFGFDNLQYPIDGNVGVRYVKTDTSAHGYTVFNNTAPTVVPGAQVGGPGIPIISSFSKKQDFENTYNNVLPSLNLRLKASDTLQFRAAFASALSRPDFSQLQAYTTLSETASVTNNLSNGTVVVNSVDLSGKGAGNPLLKPTTANQVDVTAEWYFAPGGSLTLAVFNKQLKDIIVNQIYSFSLNDTSGKPHAFAVTGPVNGAKGRARGLELAYQQYFDRLPGWLSGIGVQANYTYVDSHQDLYSPVYQAYCTGAGTLVNLNLNMNGCDTNGQTFGNLPLQNLSRNAYNLALMYDKGPFSARLAYSWRGKSLQAVNVNGTQGSDGTDTNPNSATNGQHNVVWGLPTYAGAYGQLDASVFYKISENLSLGLEAQNITDAKYTQLMDQSIGTKGRAWFVSGPRYTAQLRYAF
ncbi:MAG: TonB-dependent receptor domain-containing protein, partial [Sphingomonadaceae bacterium]